MSKRASFIGSVALAVWAITGCGSGEGGGSNTAPTGLNTGSPIGTLNTPTGAATASPLPTAGTTSAATQAPVTASPGFNPGFNPGTGQESVPGAGQDTLDGVAASPIGSTQPGGSDMPCEVTAIVEKACQKCHAAQPIFGAPMALVSLTDFQQDYMATTTTELSGQTMKMAELVRIRVNAEMGTRPMPQGEPLSETELATLNDWLTNGTPAGTACEVGPAVDMGTVDTGPKIPVTSADNIQDQCTEDSAYEPLVAVGDEVCYDFAVHGASGPTDTSKFTVQTGESYSEFYYKVPWPSGWIATRFGTKFDREEVLHHWLMFANNNLLGADGLVARNVTGSTLATDSELIAGWAVGGCTTTYPDDVGVALPQSQYIMVQWHHYNSTRGSVPDGSAAQICVVPPGSRPNTAGLTFLGTENISVRPGAEGKAVGTCINTSGAPITILGFTPHMHEIGVHMTSEIMRAGSTQFETVFDKPFTFDYQTNYMLSTPIVMQPGDAIRSTCTFQNRTAGTVGFGQSTKLEMCYQFTVAYPHGALNNGVPSLIGATNTCWQLGE